MLSNLVGNGSKHSLVKKLTQCPETTGRQRRNARGRQAASTEGARKRLCNFLLKLIEHGRGLRKVTQKFGEVKSSEFLCRKSGERLAKLTVRCSWGQPESKV
jgi:hypothetical protein